MYQHLFLIGYRHFADLILCSNELCKLFLIAKKKKTSFP